MNKAIESFASLLSFFTAIPMGKKYSLEEVALNFYLVPFIALITGSVFAIVIFLSSLVFNPIVYSSIGILSLALITRAQQIDALMDFCDGLLCFGNHEEKIRAMRDSAIGAGAMFGSIITLILQIGAISMIPKYALISSALSFELAGKYSMIFLSAIGKPLEDSSALRFCSSFKGYRGVIKFIVATSITYISLFIILDYLSALIIIASCFAVSLFLSIISNINFGGINGDVVGASNQISGTITLLLISIIK